MLTEAAKSRFLLAICVVLDRWFNSEVLFVVSDTRLNNCRIQCVCALKLGYLSMARGAAALALADR